MIEGTLVNLEALEGDFAEKLNDWINTPGWYAAKHWERWEPRPPKKVEKLIEKWEKEERTDLMGIRTRGDDPQPIGLAGWYWIQHRLRTTPLFLFIGDERYLGGDEAADALLLIVRLQLETWNQERVELRIPDYDEGRLAVVRRCGFVEEGRLREAVYREGQAHDVVQFGLLRAEWPGYEAQLARVLGKDA